MDKYCVYILTNKNKSTLYIGVTNDLQRRVEEHELRLDLKSFSSRYNLKYLVYYEYFPSIIQAINRKNQLKKWIRAKKEALIHSFNPNWEFLNDQIC